MAAKAVYEDNCSNGRDNVFRDFVNSQPIGVKVVIGRDIGSSKTMQQACCAPSRGWLSALQRCGHGTEVLAPAQHCSIVLC